MKIPVSNRAKLKKTLGESIAREGKGVRGVIKLHNEKRNIPYKEHMSYLKVSPGLCRRGPKVEKGGEK